jgi:hypothetical protein
LTVNVKLCVAAGLTPFDAVNCRLYIPPVPDAGVPESKPPAERLRPLGKDAPVLVNVIAVGKPEAVSWNIVPAVPTVKVVLAALVKLGASLTVSVKLCVASGDTVFDAWNVSE